MAANLVSDGARYDWIADADYNSGDLVVITSGLAGGAGVVMETVTTGGAVAVAVENVFSVPKATGEAWTGLDDLYVNGSGEATTTSAGGTPLGVAFAPAASGDTTGNVKLALSPAL